VLSLAHRERGVAVLDVVLSHVQTLRGKRLLLRGAFLSGLLALLLDGRRL